MSSAHSASAAVDAVAPTPSHSDRRRHHRSRTWPQTHVAVAPTACRRRMRLGAPQIDAAPRVPHVRLVEVPQSSVAVGAAHRAPRDASPSSVVDAPHITSVRQALARGLSTPPPMRWLPQLMCAFHGVGSFRVRRRSGIAGERLSPAARRRARSGTRRPASGRRSRAVLGGVLQDRLDEVRRQRRIRLEHQRDGARDDRGRHARAAQAQIRLRRGVDACPRAAPPDASRRAGSTVGERFDADARARRGPASPRSR